MPRKLVKNLSISTLIVAGALSPLNLSGNVFAETATTERAWSISEAKEIYHDYKTQMETTCGDDYGCQYGFLDTLKQQDSKYNVVEAYLRRSFWISAVNPEQNTIKGYFQNFSYNMWEMRMEEAALNPEEEPFLEELYSSVSELYAYWLSEDYSNKWFIAQIRRGEPVSGLHLLAKAKADFSSFEWFPAETEVELRAPDADLADNSGNPIYYYIDMSTNGSFSNISDYSECINSPDYTSGMECRLMFKEDGSFAYLPFSTQVVTNTEGTNTEGNGTSNTSGNDSSSSDNTSNTSDSTSSISGDGSSSTSSNSADASTATDATATTNAFVSDSTTPDTGEATAPQENSTEFPWWLGAIFLLGFSTLTWLFWPQNHKIPKKA